MQQPQVSPLEYMMREYKDKNESEEQFRSRIGRFGITGEAGHR